jgi:hypothetical protein
VLAGVAAASLFIGCFLLGRLALGNLQRHESPDTMLHASNGNAEQAPVVPRSDEVPNLPPELPPELEPSRPAANDEPADRPALAEKPETDVRLPDFVNNPPRRFLRRTFVSEEALRQQLLHLPEVSITHLGYGPEQLEIMLARATDGVASSAPPVLVTRQAECQGLPFRAGSGCVLDHEAAETLADLSPRLHDLLAKGQPDLLRSALFWDQWKVWLRGAAVPCLVQVLQAEGSEVRTILIDVLSKIDDKRATQALAKRALLDLNPQIREAAARALARRRREDYAPLLLAGLHYPWGPVASHAAEALVFLNDRDSVPYMKKMLTQPEPWLPFPVREGKKEVLVVREVVRINHLSNCMLCHPPTSAGTGLVRGQVPIPGFRVPGDWSHQPLGFGYGEPLDPAPKVFVHADTTFLRPDFSVMQRTRNYFSWPEEQRFDYIVRTRPATAKDVERAAEFKASRQTTEAREAVLFAIRELTSPPLNP